jgi:hypothetical protein
LRGIFPASQGFHGGEKLILLKIDFFTQFEEKHLSLEIKPSLLEGAASRTFFPY